jgi:26S proteasome regulatory subunit N1
MAKENGQLTAAEKGKGKMKDDKIVDGDKKPEEVKKDKDGKPIVNGKRGEESQEGMDFVTR